MPSTRILNRIHYFNPGHETAILQGTRNYTAPTNVRVMQRDLESLPLWYAERGDWVYVNTLPDLANLPVDIQAKAVSADKLSAGTALFSSPLLATPWGISPQSLYLFERLRARGYPLLVSPWKEIYSRLSGRQTAAECLRQLRSLLPDYTLPEVPRFFSDTTETLDYLRAATGALVLKTPYSSSGRGLLWLHGGAADEKSRQWIRGAIRKQGMLSVERAQEKIEDFAMEFRIDDPEHVHYEGLSLFRTEERGAYTGNLLDEQERMRQHITQSIGEALFERVKEAVRATLATHYAPHYTGCVGVDMLLYRNDRGAVAIHPCVEVNMRHTMGWVALRLYQRYVAPGATGRFLVTFDKDPGEAYRIHQRMTAAHPLKSEAGKVRQGYLSLCPVTEETHYRAYLLII